MIECNDSQPEMKPSVVFCLCHFAIQPLKEHIINIVLYRNRSSSPCVCNSPGTNATFFLSREQSGTVVGEKAKPFCPCCLGAH